MQEKGFIILSIRWCQWCSKAKGCLGLTVKLPPYSPLKYACKN